ncbi:MAG: hypothetical protein E7442_05825 [Ruminococcaceae bacterium]|nr:hypothetical protein [Oscillospiraceae bacterium]
MYGYIRPLRGELRVRDLERYNEVYCGLCTALKKRYGPLARFLLSYDLTFLALLLGGDEGCGSHFCPLHPLRRRRCGSGSGIDMAADGSVILSYHKLCDEVRDNRGLKRLRAGLLRTLLRGAYHRVRERLPETDESVSRELARLAVLEEKNCASLDESADCFAQLLAAFSVLAADNERQRVLRELLYHVGRSIYILDAVDDLQDDVRAGRYNPLRFRWGDKPDEAAMEEIRGTLNLSQRMAASALQLLERDENTPITENILMLGLPAVSGLVLSGEWKNKKKLARQWRRRDRRLEL